MLTKSKPLRLKKMTPRIQLRMFHTIALHLEIDSDMVKNLKTKEMISILPL
jgi:hypothetical protein